MGILPILDVLELKDMKKKKKTMFATVLNRIFLLKMIIIVFLESYLSTLLSFYALNA